MGDPVNSFEIMGADLKKLGAFYQQAFDWKLGSPQPAYTMIRNQCVNDGRPESGGEVRNAQTLGAYLAGPGVDIQQYESRPGRGSMALRIEGGDKKAPSLLMMGHIDVVPADPNGWKRDPFCGDLVDGEVWGRGAIDMLSITATMAVAVKKLMREGWKPKGTLIFSGM